MLEKELKDQITLAVEQQNRDHPVDPEFKHDPDCFRTEKSPPDFIYNGKIIAYYDTQLAYWVRGDRDEEQKMNNIFTSKQELINALKSEYPDLDTEDRTSAA